MAETSPKQQRTKKGNPKKGEPKKSKTKNPGKYVVDVYIDYDDASTFTPECAFRIPSARNLIVLLEKGKKFFGFKIVARKVKRGVPSEGEKVGKIESMKTAGTIGSNNKVSAQNLLDYLQSTFGSEGRKEHSFGDSVDISVFTSARRDITGEKEMYSLSFSVGRSSGSKGKTQERPRSKESPPEPKQPREKRERKTPTKEEAIALLKKEEGKLENLKKAVTEKTGKEAKKLQKLVKQKENYIAKLRVITNGERAEAKASRDSAETNLAAYF